MRKLGNNGRRVAIVYGVRTPFIKSGTLFKNLSAQELGRIATVELINRIEIDPKEIDEVIFGTVIPSPKAPNLAREISLGAGIPSSVPAYTVSRACASANQAITNAAESIMSGNADVVVAGGAESLSDMPVLFSKRFRAFLYDSYKGKNLIQKIKPFLNLHLRDLAPDIPALAEPSTGLTMGESAEKMARENHISREDQDAFAYRSHMLANKATADGVLKKEIIHTLIPPDFSMVANFDNGIRGDTSIEALSKLRPVFDRKYGTVTAANSSPLTDGASSLILMAVERAGLTLRRIDLVEMHEAFAAQALSNIRAFASKKFAQEKLGRNEPIGEIDMDRFNVYGGSIAIGHPFGATGGRLTITILNELRRRGGNFGLITVCAAGALGMAMVVERE